MPQCKDDDDECGDIMVIQDLTNYFHNLFVKLAYIKYVSI